MSISSAMYAAVTGLSALSTGMQVISNNIANVNTYGFKAGRTNYEDLISQDYLSNGRIQQIGRGVKVASVQQMFTQGSFINSAQDTDMAIAGEGFFVVRDRVTNELMYTRAGNFTFDSEGVLETPAGYVLQGWELSIPKPGQEAVRIGQPTDVKVVILNAPPVETSQIKVVANLNADDTCAYIYSSAGFAELYADMVASGPAESARTASANAVYNYALNGSGYINTSDAFNQAYLDWMSANGYKAVPAGSTTFVKSAITNPSTTEMATATRLGISAGNSALNITYGSSAIKYPMSATGLLYDFNYNSAYRNYLISQGYTEDPVGVFYKTTRLAADPTDLTNANTTALLSAKISSYPSNNATSNAIYLSAYNDFMVVTRASQNYVAPVRNYSTSASASTMAAAAAFALASAGLAAYPTVNDYSALLYVEAYAHYMVGQGLALDPAYPTPEVPPGFYGSATATQKGAAAAAASAAVRGGIDTGFTTYAGAPVYAQLMYDSEYLASLSAQGYDISTYLAPTVPSFVPPATATQDAAAVLSARTQVGSASFVLGAGTTVQDLEYLAYYTKELENQIGTTTITHTNPDASTLRYQSNNPVTLTNPDLGNAINAGETHAHAVDNTFVTYPAANGNQAANLAYVAGYTKWLIDNGYVLDDSTYTPPSLPAATQFTLAAPQSAKDAADAAGVAAAKVAGAPSTYTYPAGTTSPFSAWDQAYLAAYDTAMATQGFPDSQINITGYLRVTNQAPSQTETNMAISKGLEAAEPYGDSSYPSEPPETSYSNAYNKAYEDYMSSLGYVKITPQPTQAPYFQSAKVISATSAVMLEASKAARAAAETAAKNAGQAAYNRVYKEEYDKALADLQTQGLEPWLLEGMGFAGAWDATDKDSVIDPENYTHSNSWTIYDSLGTAHTLTVYYQPNPYMENVWDYIITCDPEEDARKDVNNTVYMNGATFAGLIQKGKITFTADGPDRHGGLIKDIEAQNIDSAKTAIAKLTSASAIILSPATASSLNHATFGGYYTGQPEFSATTKSLVATERTYTITWVSNLGTVPNVSGFHWVDSDGGSGNIQIYDKNYTGPYVFGSGLTISFSKGGTPMGFTSGDTLTVKAHSEAIGWTNLAPNEEGYFDFDVAFVQSASMALHPPYPEGLPTIIQHIALDMGAKYNLASDDWILDEQGTTQYASKSLNIFSSQDGYPPGSLQRVSIDKDGVLTGIYTNGRQQPLYQIGLARFLNPWGLAKLGDNVYMETRWSGSATLNPPGYGGTGTVRANFLEQSNTDLAEEIVNMIVTQRGFQANSKVVTTTDTMLAEVIEMKR